jgi:hypothetical protein
MSILGISNGKDRSWATVDPELQDVGLFDGTGVAQRRMEKNDNTEVGRVKMARSVMYYNDMPISVKTPN